MFFFYGYTPLSPSLHFLSSPTIDAAYISPGQRAAYPYLQKLLALDGCRPSHGIPLAGVLAAINTPLVWQAWAQALQPHPDKDFGDYIIRGIKEGFRIGFRYSERETTRSCKRNMSSAYEHQKVVTDYLVEECRHARIAGPFPGPPLPHLQVNSFGVIPKRHQQNKWRLILDLSSPEKHSVNDGIEPSLCSLSYISIDDIAGVILQLGAGALIAKTDVKHAYRQIPVHPEDRPLMGMRWKEHYFVDTVLPFGLRSAPLIFTAVADALEWIVRARGADNIFHYIDDFVLLGPPDSDICEQNLRLLMQSCDNLGVLIAQEKTEGPSTRLTVLGIEFDTVAMELRLPADKLHRLSELLSPWRGKNDRLAQRIRVYCNTAAKCCVQDASSYAEYTT